MTAASLHFLGGVGGWAWPTGGDAARGTPAMKVDVQFADGTSEEHVLKNGETFADTFARADVPLSADAGDFTRRGQLRYFALNLGKKGDAVEDRARELRQRHRAGHRRDHGQRRSRRQADQRAVDGAAGQAPPRRGRGPKEGGQGDAPAA